MASSTIMPPSDSPHFPHHSDSSDESIIIEDVSFEYVQDAAGQIVRRSRGGRSSNSPVHSSPPTPQDDQHEPPLQKPHNLSSPAVREALAAADSHPRRGSLSRSESAHSIMMGASTSTAVGSTSALSASTAPLNSMVRTLQRTSSGPVRAAPRRADGVEEPPTKTRTSALTAHDPVKIQELQQNKQRATEVHSRLVEEKRRTAEKENMDALSSAGSVEQDREHEHHWRRSSDQDGQDRHFRQQATRSQHDVSSSAMLPTGRAASSAMRSSAGGIGRPLGEAGASQRARGMAVPPSTNAARRIANKTGSKYPVGSVNRRITETEVESESCPTDPEDYQSDAQPEPLSRSGNTRPRRSASLSDALAHDEHGMLRSSTAQNGSLNGVNRQPHSRPTSSLGYSTSGDTLVHNEDGTRRSAISDNALKRKQLSEDLEKLSLQQAPQQPSIVRKSPSPTQLAGSSASTRLRATSGHRRRDSDTVRNTQATAGPSGSVGSPTPAAESAAAPPDRHSPLSRAAVTSARHRRSPTAPEVPTTSKLIGSSAKATLAGKTWASGGSSSHAPSDREPEHHERRENLVATRDPPPAPVAHSERRENLVASRGPPPAPQNQVNMDYQRLYVQQQKQQAAQSKLPATMVVNKRPFYRLDLIGKGGSSRVFRVLNYETWEMFAIKRVSLDQLDAETFKGYTNEISLLKRLEGNARIIRLYESEMKPGNTQGSKGHLVLLMELGEIDMAKLLSEQMKEPPNMVWVAYYWQQMLQAVQIIHDEKIVHSDLKPANFVMVKGQLKLIDFGIANAIANDTTNIQRDHHMGTVNYMSPEAIEGSEGNRKLKVGRPSDVWSLGCILYQMVYGHPPFHHLTMYQKMKAIPDPSHVINFPEFNSHWPGSQASTPNSSTAQSHPRGNRVRQDVIDTIQRCLQRNSKDRATIPELLDLDWLTMRPLETAPPPPVNVHEHLAEDQAVIDPHFMMQLLEYGMRLGQQQKDPAQDIDLESEARRLITELRKVTTSQ